MKKALFIWWCFMVFVCVTTAQTSPNLQEFVQRTDAKVSLHRATGLPNFIRFSESQHLQLRGNSVAALSRDFMAQGRSFLGSFKGGREMRLVKQKRDSLGFSHLTFQQYHHGIPIYDGQLKFHYDSKNQLRSVNGNYLKHIKISPTPLVSEQEGEQLALNEVQAQFPEAANLVAIASELQVFRYGLAQGIPGDDYLTYRVEITNHKNVREVIFVDAHDGHIVEQFTGMHSALFRRLYEVNTSNEIWTEGDPLPGSLDQWQQNELETAAHTYYFFFHALGLDSYDDSGAEMKTVNNDPGVSCPNAQWSGGFARYCTGTASDDVVAHEWGHAYTDFSSNLIYAWQAGAINESLSDIWGETIDLINAYEDEGEDLSLRSTCGSSDRWMLGEDASAFGSPLRDMWDPTCKGDPGKVSDPEYHCSSFDNGGVHSNSGVPNHAYALLVDGGNYNGYTISGLGLVKAAHIFSRANFNYLTETSDFGVFADALETAARDLVGIDLEGFSTNSTAAGPSGEVISLSDVDELEKVLLAVEMRLAPNCNFDPLLQEDTLLCVMALPDSAIYFENFETGLDEWVTENIPENPGTWEVRDWEAVGNLPDNRAGMAAFGVDPVNGDCDTDLENGIIRLESPVINIPASIQGQIDMAFHHYVAMENLWDGGNIKYRLNGGAWTLLPGSAFTTNGYNNTLNGGQNDNPLASEEAFTGTDEGSVSGSWAISLINLSSLGVVAESSIQFRFEVGTDGCNGRVGWYLDDISIFSCGDCEDIVSLADHRLDQEVLFQAGTSIFTKDTIGNGSNIWYSGGTQVELQSGFEAHLGAIIEVQIDGCQIPADVPRRAQHDRSNAMGTLPTEDVQSPAVQSND